MIFQHCTGVCSNSHMEIYHSCCRVRFSKFIKLSKLSGSPGARCIGAFSRSFSTFSHTENLNIVNTTIFRIKYLVTTKNSSIFALS